MSSRFNRINLLIIAALLCAVSAMGQFKIAEAFSPNMVLQRNKPVPVWGRAGAGNMVTVQFAGQQLSAKADTGGKWMVVLKPLHVSALPQSLTVSCGDTAVTYTNILVGDVWLCSGQSNMEYPLDRTLKKYAAPQKGMDEGQAALTENKPAAIRYLYVEKNLKQAPVLPTKGWVDGNDSMVRYVTDIGYFFAREIYNKTAVPVGIISDSWGGTRIEQWQPDWSYVQSAAFKDSITGPDFKIDGVHPGQMYNGLIAPLQPFAIKGVLWYQGETNAMLEDQQTYPAKFKLLVDTWRQLFRDKKMPFYYVQIAPHLYTNRKDKKQHTPQLLPAFWEAQTKCLAVKNTGMVITTDLVDKLADIHPSYKWVVAHRLAALALEKDYGIRQTVISGPVFQSAKQKNNTLVLHFNHVVNGLKSSDGNALNWFEVAGADKKYVPALAVADGDKLIVSSPEIAAPKYVRFAWDEKAQPNLVNSEGWPAVPFRWER